MTGPDDNGGWRKQEGGKKTTINHEGDLQGTEVQRTEKEKDGGVEECDMR